MGLEDLLPRWLLTYTSGPWAGPADSGLSRGPGTVTGYMSLLYVLCASPGMVTGIPEKVF